MQTSKQPPATPAFELEKVQQSLGRMGILSRTALCAALLVAMGLDTVLPSRLEHLPITIAQSGLLCVVFWLAARGKRGEPLRPTPGRASPPRTTLYRMVVTGLAAFALGQKWWIVLRDLDRQAAYEPSYRIMSATLTLAGVILAIGGAQRLARYFAAFAEHPARQTAISFIGLTVFGSFLLTLPVCVRDPHHVSFIDALFMATSAVCVTGLAVHGVMAEYTFWGQAVLLALVQAGGLGIMVLSASLVVLTGRKLRARSSAALVEVLDTDSVSSLRSSIASIVLFTLAIELTGAALLYAALTWEVPEHVSASASPLEHASTRLWAALFHAVSAFCNAGFTLTGDSLVSVASDYAVCSVLMCLIMLGGVGFPVLAELFERARLRRQGRRAERLSLHTRVVLSANVILLFGVTAILCAVEWRASLAALPWQQRVFAGFFQSVTLRTAGFNSVDFASFTHAGLMISMMVMFVGASPGGTGGGLKVTTFAVLFATMRAELRGKDDPSLFDRRLPSATVRRAIAVGFVAVVVLTVVVLLLLLVEPYEPLRLAFEAVSAFGTVGLSTDLTPSLSTPGKLILIVTMLIGRVGPLTAALAASERRADRVPNRAPHERVLIG